jgi:hypothetical protein
MRRRVLARGAASVSIAPVHVPDWLAAGVVGFGPLLVRVGRAIAKTHRAGGGRPILVVGHSAGGILARLAMSPVPFRGRRAAVADAVGALVTLGTPHGLARAPLPYAHQGLTAVRFLDAVTPGAFFAPRTAYLTVGSDLVRPEEAPARWLWDRLRGRAFTHLVGPHGALGGDGIVQLEASQLAGAEHTTFHDVRHGHIGGPWYGDDEIIERWWPRAVEAWRGALAAREAQE